MVSKALEKIENIFEKDIIYKYEVEILNYLYANNVIDSYFLRNREHQYELIKAFENLFKECILRQKSVNGLKIYQFHSPIYRIAMDVFKKLDKK